MNIAPDEAIVVTGAGGYLGGRLVRHLVQSGHSEVRALTTTDTPWLASPATVVELTDRAQLEKALVGASTVIHLAGANEAVTKTDPDAALAGTTIVARRVAEACSVVGVPRIVYVSTVHVYGAALVPGARITEATVPEPRSVYAVARLASEHLLASADSDVVVMRLTNAIGAPEAAGVDRWSLVSNDLCRQAVTTGELRLKSDGRQWRDFVSVVDVCRILVAAVDEHRVPVGTYNLGSGHPRTILELAELVQETAERETGHRPDLHAPDAEGASVSPYSIATDRLEALGLGASIEIQDAIAETLRFCADQQNVLKLEERR